MRAGRRRLASERSKERVGCWAWNALESRRLEAVFGEGNILDVHRSSKCRFILQARLDVNVGQRCLVEGKLEMHRKPIALRPGSAGKRHLFLNFWS